jgi:hypothetical protein
MSLPGSPDKRVVTLESKPASPDEVDLLDLDFISAARYEAADLHQVLKDWLRLQNIIHINEKPFAVLVDEVKQAHWLPLLKAFRDEGPGELADRLDLLALLYQTLNSQLSNYLHKTRHTSDPIEKVDRERIVAIFENAFGDSDTVDFTRDDVLSQAVDLLFAGIKHLNFDVSQLKLLSSRPGFTALAEVVREAGTYFVVESKESDAILVDIWRKHLLQDVVNEEHKAEYIHFLSQYAHQGGFLFPSLTQHSEYLSYEQSDDGMPTYAINGAECINDSRIRFFVENNVIHVLEEAPIRRLSDNNNATYIENEDDRPVILTRTKHHLAVARQGGVGLTPVLATDTVYNHQAMELVNAAFQAHRTLLTDYADHYCQFGHDASQIYKIMQRYPKISEKIPVKTLSFLDRHIKFNQKMHHEGAYIGMSFPGYANNVFARLSQIRDLSEAQFLYTVKLLRRMNRYDLAAQIVLPYVIEQARASDSGIESAHEAAIAVVESATAIKAAYPFMRDKFLSLQQEQQSPPRRALK